MVQSNKDIRVLDSSVVTWDESWGIYWTTDGYWTDGGLSFNATEERNDIRVDQFGYSELHNTIVKLRWTVKERAVKRWNKKRRHR